MRPPCLARWIGRIFVQLLFFASSMIDPTIPFAPSHTPLSLVPAQVVLLPKQGNRGRKKSLHRSGPPSSELLVPSQVIRAVLRDSAVASTGAKISTVDPGPTSAATNVHIGSESHNLGSTMAAKCRKSRSRRKKKAVAKEMDDPSPGSNCSDADTPATLEGPTHTTAEFPREGNCPDVYWRSVPMEHLRLHPRFAALPARVPHLAALEDARNFRQDSWQWDTLHAGRCTTSQAAACLGFLEHMAGEVLQVPPSWRRGGRGAYQRLRQPPLRTLEEMNRVLCPDSDAVDAPLPVTTRSTSDASRKSPVSPWSDSQPTSGDNEPPLFAASYDFDVSESEMLRRQKLARKFGETGASTALRMSWGTAQEGTALLAALNHFVRRDPGFVMREAGMCGAGLALNETGTLLIGASPDAILCHSDGRIEACEVKNHCPFVVPFVKKGKSRTGKPSKRFRLMERPLDGTVFSHYIPQLMMEMLCLGPECRSAVMVRLTATKGALLLRMHRCDEWIEEMLHFLRKFQSDFVDRGVIPAPNFFLVNKDNHEAARYRRFLNKTLELRNAVEVICHIPPEQVQRLPKEWPLFLDVNL